MVKALIPRGRVPVFDHRDEELKDIASRRRREVANLLLQYFVAIAVVGTVGYCLWTLTNVVLKDNNNNAFLMILGSSLSWMGVLIAFCFPSSIGSQKSQEHMHQMLMQFTNKVPPVTGPALDSVVEQAREAKDNDQQSTAGNRDATAGSGLPRGAADHAAAPTRTEPAPASTPSASSEPPAGFFPPEDEGRLGR